VIKRIFATVLLLLSPGILAAQTSQFGVRALGLPVLPLSTRGQGSAGAFGMFDPEGALNPASLSNGIGGAATFNLRQYWRTSENPFGDASGNDTNFPLMFVGGALGLRFNVGVSVAAYTDRTFALTLTDTLVVRGEPVGVNDTLISKGGINDIRVALGYKLSRRFAVGLGLHALTGTNRFEYRRSFSDSSYLPIRLRNELSFAGPGVSVGLAGQVASGIRVTGLFRWDGDLGFNKDSTRLSQLRMPLTYGGGIGIEASANLSLGVQAIGRNWSVADQGIRDRGGVGALNTWEFSAGGELVTHQRRANQFPIRFGARYAQLPFPMVAGGKGREIMASVGTGIQVGGGRGRIDFALERTWRNEGEEFKERSFMLGLGVSIRP
jgi:hypothetical protein